MKSHKQPGARLKTSLVLHATRVSIRIKIYGMVVGIILLLGLSDTILVREQLQTELGTSLKERGIAIAGELATRSSNPILTEDKFALYQLIRDTLENNPDVRYAFVLDPTGRPLVHSFGEGVPLDLLTINPIDGKQAFSVQILNSEEGLITDLAVPILGGRAGTARVGLSHQRLAASVATATWELIGLTILALTVGLFLAFLLTRLLTRPVFELVHMARAVGKGDLTVKPIPHMEDEIGELTSAFSGMTVDLAHSRADLLRRMQALAALTATAITISADQSLSDILQAALREVIKVMGLRAGWIFLANGQPANTVEPPCSLSLVVQSGLSPEFVAEEARRDPGSCICGQVMRNNLPLIVHDIHKECSRLSLQVIEAEGLVCHVSIPLVARNRVVGVMNVASDEAREFTLEEMALLDSVGRQIGVAVENANLWEEKKEKEILRSQFLKKIIVAQESERKRLARELHDEAAQTLTALALGLHSLEESNGLTTKESQSIQNLYSLTTDLRTELHHLAVQLRPSALDRIGLVGALEQYMGEFRQRYGLETLFETEKMEGVVLPAEVETSLYRIIQEALTNVARHSEATRVAVLLQVRDGNLVATVEDNGKGLNPEPDHHASHLGLFGMQERAELLNGSVSIESVQGAGVTIFIKIPIFAGENSKASIPVEQD